MNKLAAFLKTPSIVLITMVLLAQALLFHRFARNENAPVMAPLAELPQDLGQWMGFEDIVMDDQTRANLKPDDYLARLYRKPGSAAPASLFIAYFATQRTGKAPHSQRNCLPGHGWVPNRVGYLSIPVSGGKAQISVNHFVVAKGDEKSVVLYWYQTGKRVVANEYMAKIYLVLDAIRYRRSDTAMVRVMVPVIGDREEDAQRAAVELAQLIHEALSRHIPPATG